MSEDVWGKQHRLDVASPLALFNATCTRLSLDRLLPSRAYLRFTGQIIASEKRFVVFWIW